MRLYSCFYSGMAIHILSRLRRNTWLYNHRSFGSRSSPNLAIFVLRLDFKRKYICFEPVATSAPEFHSQYVPFNREEDQYTMGNKYGGIGVEAERFRFNLQFLDKVGTLWKTRLLPSTSRLRHGQRYGSIIWVLNLHSIPYTFHLKMVSFTLFNFYSIYLF